MSKTVSTYFAFFFFLTLTSCSNTTLQQGSTKLLQDCASCPTLIPLPLGQYMMGDLHGDGRTNEQPPQKVSIDKRIAFAKTPTTVAQYRYFIEQTGYVSESEADTKKGCWGLKDDFSAGWLVNTSWKQNKLNQTENHPVVCVSRNDAIAYTNWLTTLTGNTYRLPTDEEWEYAARANTKSKYFFGEDATQVCDFMNHADKQMKIAWNATAAISECDDGHLTTSPIGSYPANDFGLLDMYGNVWEWTNTCHRATLNEAKPDSNTCQNFTLRGASYASMPIGITSSYRVDGKGHIRTEDWGFRVIRELQ